MLSRLADPAEQEVGDWAGDRGWRFAEPQEDLVALADHVVEGEADDAAERLGVEQDDGGRDPGPQRQVVAGQDAAEQVQSLVLRERCRLADHRGGQPEAPGELAGCAPQQEGPEGVAAVLVVLGVPGVDVGLAAGRQGEAAVGEPLQEGGGVLDLVAGVAAAGRGDRLLLRAGAEPGQDFPGGEAADELGMAGVGDAPRGGRPATARTSRSACQRRGARRRPSGVPAGGRRPARAGGRGMPRGSVLSPRGRGAAAGLRRSRCCPCGRKARSGRTAGCPWRAGSRPAGRARDGSGRCRRPAARRAGRRRRSGCRAGRRAACPRTRSVRRRRTARTRRSGADRGAVAGAAARKRPLLAAAGADSPGRTARSEQVRQTYPSGQLPALCLRRPQRQHSAMYQRSYCSSVA